MEKDRRREREKKRAKLEYDSINPAIERVEWQAGGQAGTTERTFHSMNRKEEEMTKGTGGGRAKGKASSTGGGGGDDDGRRRDSAHRKVGRLITR